MNINTHCSYKNNKSMRNMLNHMEICINIKEIKSFPDTDPVNTELPVVLVQINNSRQKYFPGQISFINVS